jgi:hypothetical protein
VEGKKIKLPAEKSMMRGWKRPRGLMIEEECVFEFSDSPHTIKFFPALGQRFFSASYGNDHYSIFNF